MRFDDYYDSKIYITEDNKISGWQNYVERIPILKKGVDIITRLEKEGGPDAKAYIVGGAVRDVVTGEKEPDDIDIATNVPMDKIEEIFGKSHDIGSNKDFGIVIVNYEGEDFEVAQFRSDGKSTDGRRPDSVEIVLDFETDAGRRDFTINAMGVDKNGVIYDYFDGQNDIKNRVIKFVGDPEERIEEDFIRMLRAIRFGSRLGFELSDETLKAIQGLASKISPKKKGDIRGVAGERIYKELKKMAQQEGPKFAEAILMLDKSGMLQYILPEVAKMKEFEHSVEHHPEGGVFQHTIEALRSSKVKDPIVNMGILLHDVGKVKTHELDADGKHRYFGHAQAADEIIEDIAQRFHLDNKSKKAIQFAAINHMKMHDLLKMSNSKIAQLMDDDAFDILVKVAEADAKSRGKLFDKQGWQQIMNKIDKIASTFEDRKAREAVKKVVNGRWVMELRGIKKPGPEIGRIINTVMDEILNKNININDKETIAKLIQNA